MCSFYACAVGYCGDIHRGVVGTNSEGMCAGITACLDDLLLLAVSAMALA